jgi:hypothetical protein
VSEQIRDSAERREESIAVVQLIQVPYRQANHRNQIGSGPVAVHVGFPDADVSSQERVQKKPFIVHGHNRMQRML